MDADKLTHKMDGAVTLLKSLSNPQRLKIVCTLYNGEKSVSELESIIKLSQSALSQHLARLRHDKIVGTRREGQTIFYSLNGAHAQELLACLHKLFCENESDDK